MPIKRCTLPEGGQGWQWGDSGACYADRADAEKQAQAAYANGYTGDELTFALDLANRFIDADGRLHVKISHISKANVCPYRGSEIPDAAALGLDPERVYYLWRHPEELAKAAATSNNIQILEIHTPVSAGEPQKDRVVGSTGTDGEFRDPYLDNSLVFWDAEAIAGIGTLDEPGPKRQLSCGYRYRADMTPGNNGSATYDGIMREIVFNHVALVAAGRAGPDVIVADEKLETLSMSKLGEALKPKLEKLTTAGALDLAKVLLALDEAEKEVDGEDDEEAKEKAEAEDRGRDSAEAERDAEEEGEDEAEEESDKDDNSEEARDRRRGRDSRKRARDSRRGARDKRRANDKMPWRGDAEIEKACEDARKRGRDKAMGRRRAHDKNMGMDAAAVDRAIKAATDAVVQRMTGAREAEKAVLPYVGELAITYDSADAVYEAALKLLGVDVKGVHPSAFPVILKAQPKPGEALAARQAQDSAAPSAEVYEMFPALARVRQG